MIGTLLQSTFRFLIDLSLFPGKLEFYSWERFRKESAAIEVGIFLSSPKGEVSGGKLHTLKGSFQYISRQKIVE